jgi:hypothetical protein
MWVCVHATNPHKKTKGSHTHICDEGAFESPVFCDSEEWRRTAEVCHFETKPNSAVVGLFVLTTQNSSLSHAA